MRTHLSLRRNAFVPALGFHWLTGLYDPLVRRWTATTHLHASVIEALDLKPGMRLLELGAGPGRLAIEIKRRHPQVTVETVDIDRTMITRARRHARAAEVDIAAHEADMTDLPELGSFDRVVSTMVFHHLGPAEKHAALSAARSRLAPGGRFVVGDFGVPRDPLQWALFAFVQQPLDGFRNTMPHRDGRFEQAVREAFERVRSVVALRTIAGTIEVFDCSP